MATSTGEPAEQTSPDNPAPGPRVPGPPDRPPRPHRLRLLDPLRQRDFGLLWVGMTASLVGDGLYFVAIAWQVLDLSDRPSALSIVGVAWTVPQLLFLLIGGVLTDRLDRRTVLIGSDVVRGLAIGVLGILSIAGTLVLWHVVVLVAIYGAAEAFFMPAFGAIVPDLVPSDMLVQANSLDQFVRPVALRLVGPALGGLVIAGLGVGWAFIFDAASFGISVVAVAAMRAHPVATSSQRRSMRSELAEGFRYLKDHTWLWAGLIATSVGLLLFYGPWQVLVPFLVRNKLGASPAAFGLILGAGGAGAIVTSLVMGQRGLPRRAIEATFVTWAVGSLALAGFGIATAEWHAVVVAFVMLALFTAGQILWATLQHTFVKPSLLGRVSSIDWLASTALIPISFAFVGPIAAVAGARQTLIGAAVLGFVLLLAFLAIPGVRDISHERPAEREIAA